MTVYRLLINGELIAGDNSMAVMNPADETLVANSPHASLNQLNQAVAAAKAALPDWSVTPMAARQNLLAKVADVVEAHAQELGELLVQEQGKPITDAVMEVHGFVAFCRYFCGLTLPVKIVEDSEQRRVEVHANPLGVIAAMVPWNFPLILMAFKLSPALIAGNTMVLKPASTTPLSTLRIGELIKDILPAGTLNIITDKNELGAALTAHPDVNKVSFTGSTATGSKVMAGAADSIKRITLELGGNDAAVVMADTKLDDALPKIFGAAFHNAGQICIAVKRLYVHDSIYDDVCDRLVAMADATVVGNGMAESTTMGPLQNALQYNKVKALIAESQSHGTQITSKETLSGKGYFIRPTLFKDITEGSRLVDEEQFGPVLPIIRYNDEEALLVSINSSIFGLGASVWGENSEAVYHLANRIEAGTVWINKHGELDPAIPFGGAKQSGLGSELGETGLAEFTQTKIINIAK
jgi:acyl-CoA reductase-like NAD-dependent aldehyde dehydrogenase